MSTVFTSVSHMEQLRAKFRENSEPLFIRMRAELTCEAQIRLKNPLYSVAFTNSRAVSGDPHDYYSEAQYWWPDPKNSDGSFTDELTRTRSYTYCLFNLEACAVTAEIAHNRGVDLWNTVCDGGHGMKKSLDFMLPYYENPTLWSHQQLDFENIHPSAAYQLGAIRIYKKYASAVKTRQAGLQYFGALGQMGALCLLEGFDE